MKNKLAKFHLIALPTTLAGIVGHFRSLTKFQRAYQIELPADWGLWLRFSTLSALKKQLRFLQKHDHWDQAALKIYLKQIQPSFGKQVSVFQRLAESFEQTQQVGSEVYTQMYVGSQLKAKKKLRLVLRQLGAVVDDHGFLQLLGTHEFSRNLVPHAVFYTAFRADVWQAYPSKAGLNRDALGQRLHLFRSWIDLQNIRYIRQNYTGSTDFAKLQKYATTAKISLDLTTSAAFHNRSAQAFRYPQNMKVQISAANTAASSNFNNARMAEFIIDLNTRNFVSEWDAYCFESDGRVDSDPQHYSKKQLYQIANTESFNYGIPKGQQYDLPAKDHTHYYLDVKHPFDPQVRQLATQAFHSPQVVTTGGPYADLIKRLPDLVSWQKVPVSQRSAVYQEYLRFCAKTGSVPGYEGFLEQR